MPTQPPSKPPDPPPVLPENTPHNGGNTPPTTSNTANTISVENLEQSRSGLHWESQGTNPNALNSTISSQNLKTGPSPLISEVPKTLGVVSLAPDSSEFFTLENVLPNANREPVGPTTLHAPDHMIGHGITIQNLKFQAIPTPDAPEVAVFPTDHTLGNRGISPSTGLQLPHAPHPRTQHEIPHLPAKNQKIPTRDARGTHAPPLGPSRAARGAHSPAPN
ncbi:uncharacterized protein Fot_13077 [Forsythia ovata]|uniref:Uncharacterized protein n=1 Tax=Forsythia ovata TaxID=205694 RepID=A0ABD1W2G8_9LAMI